MVWLIVVVAIYLLILLGIAWISLHPYRIPIFLSPGGLGCSQEDVEFTTSDGITLRGWWVDAARNPGSDRNTVTPQHPNTDSPQPSALSPSREPKAESREPSPVAIVSHGYMMNRSELSPLAPLLVSKGVSSLYYDFRAHGRSGGRKSYLGFREKADIAAAIAFARARCPGCKIILIGSSTGAAAGALAAGDDPSIDALVLDCSYSRLPSAVLGWWRFLGGPVLAAILSPTPILCMPLAGFNPYRVDIAQALAKAGKMPVLFFHGDKDTLALPSEAKRNQDACQGPTKMVWMPGCGHAEGRWIHPELYNSELLAFLEEHVLNSSIA
jgi:pimeloyl-ACP methyl ester carboxylesterase